MNHTELRMRIPFVPFLGLVGALALWGCPGPTQTTEPIPPAPEIVSFRSSADLIEKGGTVNLTWETRNATTVELLDSGRGAVSGADTASGAVDVTVTEDTLFVLVAKNDRGLRESAVVSVRTQEPTGEVLFFATPSVVDAGGSATLAWSAPAARTVTLGVQGGAAIDIGDQRQAGSVPVTPEQDTTYELVVDGTPWTATVRTRPAIELFVANPSSMIPGEPLTLQWKTRGGTSPTIDRPGQGEVHSTSAAGEVAEGSVEVAIPAELDPAAAYTWRLTVLGASAEVVAVETLTVYVAGQPRILSSSAPRYARLGDTFTLAWTTEEADRVRVLADGNAIYETQLPEQAASHSLQFPTPAQEVVYTIVAINDRGGEDTRTHEVAPVGVTTLNTFTATPAQIPDGGDAVTLSWDVDEARRVRIVANGQYTVYSVSDLAAEMGSVTVYPNEQTTYELFADNTLGDEVSDTEAVLVDAPATLTASPSGTVAQDTPLQFTWSVGSATSEIYGLPHDDVLVRMPSTGFTDISTTGNRLPFASNADDAVASFEPPFETWLWGQRAPTRVNVSTNGFLVFGPTAGTRSVNEPLPSAAVEPFFVAPLWADLQFKPGSEVFWEVRGEAPERELVVQWTGIGVYDELSTTDLTFQARIHQTGVVHFEYQTLMVGTAVPVAGVQGPVPAQGLQVFPSLQQGEGLTLFGPVPAPAEYVAVSSDPVGGWLKLGDAYLQLEFTPSVILPDQLRMTEVMYRPAAPIATTGEWIEVFNTTSAPFDLEGFQLDFGNGQTHTITGANGTTVVPADGFLVLGQSAVTADNDGANVGYAYGTMFQLDDAGGTVSLTRGGPVASITWTSSVGGEGVSVQSDISAALYASGSGDTLCSATDPFGTQMPQQLGTPGTSGGCYPYGMTIIPGAYEDISATGTVLLGSASSYTGIGTFTLPAPFTYFGTTYTTVDVSMVGFLTFGNTLTSAHARSGDTLPSTSQPNGTVAVFWDEIVRNFNGEIYMQRQATYTIISWHDFRIWGETSSMHFQVKLFDNGTIEFHYGSMTTSSSTSLQTTGQDATAWIEREDGTSALPYSIHTVNGIQPNTGVRFSPL